MKDIHSANEYSNKREKVKRNDILKGIHSHTRISTEFDRVER